MKHRALSSAGGETAGRHRAPVRPRYGRIAVSGGAALVTAIAVLGGTGVLPDAFAGSATTALSAAGESTTVVDDTGAEKSEPPAGSAEDPEQSKQSGAKPGDSATLSGDPAERALPLAAGRATPLPPRSGSGVRIVFSEGQQRVWLVDAGHADATDDGVFRSYLVSGSIYDNLEPGTYEVYSRSRHAIGIDDSGTMEYFVRFTQGDQGAAIGFHTIPVKDGETLQTRAELGTPLSHGCIRQATTDAIALWEFAPIGTQVVVTT